MIHDVTQAFGAASPIISHVAPSEPISFGYFAINTALLPELVGSFNKSFHQVVVVNRPDQAIGTLEIAGKFHLNSILAH